MGLSLSKHREMVNDKEVWCAALLGFAKSWTWVSNWKTTKSHIWVHCDSLVYCQSEVWRYEFFWGIQVHALFVFEAFQLLFRTYFNILYFGLRPCFVYESWLAFRPDFDIRLFQLKLLDTFNSFLLEYKLFFWNGADFSTYDLFLHKGLFSGLAWLC